LSVAIRTLRTLIEGRLPPDSGLLESARLSGLGAEVFGQEAIVAEFARVGRLLGDDAEYLQSEGSLLALDGTRAIVADLYSQRLARLWWVGMPAIAATAPRPIAVPFDPDLAQVRGSVLFGPADHPDLTLLHAQHVPAVVGAALPSLGVQSSDDGFVPLPYTPAFRRRAYVRRAFSAGERAAVFCTVVEWADASSRSVTNRGLALSFRVSDSRPVRVAVASDVRPTETPWLPRA